MRKLIFSIVVLMGVASCGHVIGYRIVDKIENCDDNRFQVTTQVWHDNEIIFSQRSWLRNGYKCLPVEFIMKEKDYQDSLAKDFIEKYKTLEN